MDPTPPAILFDLDGTLVDTAPDLAAAMNAVLVHFGRSPVDVDAVRHMVGHGARRTIARGLQLTGGGSEALVEAGFPLFIDHYTANIAVGSRPWPGVETALDQLAGKGAVAAICTNKPVALAEALVAALGWSGRFAAILGGDSLPAKKPDPLHVKQTLARAGGVPARAVFVGDSAVDVAAAQGADLPAILTSFGYSDVPAAKLGADIIIDHFDALLPAIDRVAPGIFG
jgi:phosphoglycolate phosphatase